MNNDQKIIAGTVGVVLGLAVIGSIISRKEANHLVERFPHVEPKTVRKAYQQMKFNALRGKYLDTDIYNTATMDSYMIQEIARIELAKK